MKVFWKGSVLDVGIIFRVRFDKLIFIPRHREYFDSMIVMLIAAYMVTASLASAIAHQLASALIDAEGELSFSFLGPDWTLVDLKN